MDKRTKELVSIAASLAGHCRPCFIHHLAKAKELRISKEDMGEVIELAMRISKADDNSMYEFAKNKLDKNVGVGGTL